MPVVERVAVVGVGMVGGSLGRAMLRRGLAAEVVGVDSSPRVIETGVSLGAVTRGTTSLGEGVRGAGLVILAAPVGATLELLGQLAGTLEGPVVVSDVCSTKAEVAARAREVLPDGAVFIGGHPMAGSEKEGVGALDEHLFENALYVLTPEAGGPALELMKNLVLGLGSVPLIMDALHHDFLAAAVSHLPHMAATALVGTLAREPRYRDEFLTLAAGGFRDTTRVAMGSPQMWKDICLTNAKNLSLLLDSYIAELTELRERVMKGDGEGLFDAFTGAREYRLQVPSRGKGLLPAIFNLYVFVPDRPGIIGEVASRLGSAGINIAEIELLRVREEEGGPLRLGFLSDDGRRDAAALLGREGFRAEIREG